MVSACFARPGGAGSFIFTWYPNDLVWLMFGGAGFLHFTLYRYDLALFRKAWFCKSWHGTGIIRQFVFVVHAETKLCQLPPFLLYLLGLDAHHNCSNLPAAALTRSAGLHLHTLLQEAAHPQWGTEGCKRLVDNWLKTPRRMMNQWLLGLAWIGTTTIWVDVTENRSHNAMTRIWQVVPEHSLSIQTLAVK